MRLVTTKPVPACGRLALALLLLLQLGCGSSVDAPPAPQHLPVTTPEERDAIRARFENAPPAKVWAALRRLPAPGRSAAFVRQAGGKQVAEALPFSLPGDQAYAPGVNESGWFMAANAQPAEFGGAMDLAPASPELPASFAYAVYKVSDITDELRSLTVSAFGGPYGIAAYDFTGSGRGWVLLYYGSSSDPSIDLTEPAGADWTNAGDDMALLAFSLHPAAASIFSLTLSSDPAQEPQAPVAFMVSNPQAGTAPLNVTFDASGSGDMDGGTLVKFRFDPEGDGTFIDNGASTSLNHTYTTEGIYLPMLEVTDDDGLIDTYEGRVIVSDGDYDEVEDNDSTAEANVLPDSYFEAWSGNIGAGGPLDGDAEDYYTFSAESGDRRTFSIVTTEGEVYPSLEIYDAEGDQLMGGLLNISHEFGPADVAPYYLRVWWAEPSHADYFLDCGLWHESENNDDAGSADFASILGGELAGWTGSLGSGPGYTSYDGDANDWIQSDEFVRPGDTLTYEMQYDQGTGDLDITLFDGDGDILAASADTDGTEQIVHVLGPGQPSPYRLRIACVSGYSDYSLDADINFGGGENYDEVENNDVEFEANALPALPFSGFRGNVGTAGPYNGDRDWYKLELGAAATVNVTLTFDDSAGSVLQAQVWSSFDDGVSQGIRPGKQAFSATSPLVLSFSPRSIDLAPYYVVVDALEGFEQPVSIDYQLAAEIGVPEFHEVEDNDVRTQATALPFPAPDIAGFSNLYGFAGSLGAAGSNYDGDGVDWFEFQLAPLGTASFSVYFDPGTAAVTADILDAADHLIASSVIEDDHARVELFHDGGTWTAPFYVRVSTDGSTDYWIDGFRFEPTDP
jgi:hypothetical protein